jgi:hypothetical protein
MSSFSEPFPHNLATTADDALRWIDCRVGSD